MTPNNFKKELQLDEAYMFGIEHHLQNKILEIQNMQIDEMPVYESAIRKGFIVDLFIQKEILGSFEELYWPYGKTQDGEKRKIHYLNSKNYFNPETRKFVNSTDINFHGTEGSIINTIIDVIKWWK